MGNVKRLPNIAGLTEAQLTAAIVSLICFDGNATLVADELAVLFPNDSISSETINRIKATHDDRIKAKRLELFGKGQLTKLGSAQGRLMACEQIFRAAQSGTTRFIKMDRETLKQVRSVDHELALNAVRLAHRISMDLQELQMSDSFFDNDDSSASTVTDVPDDYGMSNWRQA